MELKDYEIVQQYIHEATRFMEFHRMRQAKEDILFLIVETLEGKPVSQENLAEALTKLGNPYTLGKHYETQGTVLISGRYYNFYRVILKLLLFSTTVGTILNMIQEVFFGELVFPTLKSGLYIIFYNGLLIFSIVTIAFYLAEKLKSYRILRRIMKPWTVDSLIQKNEPLKKVKPTISIYILMYGFLFGKVLATFHGYYVESIVEYFTVMYSILYALFIFRDTLKITEQRYHPRMIWGVYAFNACILMLLGGLGAGQNVFQWSSGVALESFGILGLAVWDIIVTVRNHLKMRYGKKSKNSL